MLRLQENEMPEWLQLWLPLGSVQLIVLVYNAVTQDTCIHDAKVKMPGYDGMYECTRCHKFIRTIPSKDKENTDDRAPEYLENSWEDDWD